MYDSVDLFNYLSWILSCSSWIRFFVSHSFLNSVFKLNPVLHCLCPPHASEKTPFHYLDFRDNREYGDFKRDRSWGRKPVSLVDVQSFLKILCTHSIVTVVYYESIKRELKTQSGGSIGPFFCQSASSVGPFFYLFFFTVHHLFLSQSAAHIFTTGYFYILFFENTMIFTK